MVEQKPEPSDMQPNVPLDVANVDPAATKQHPIEERVAPHPPHQRSDLGQGRKPPPFPIAKNLPKSPFGKRRRW